MKVKLSQPFHYKDYDIEFIELNLDSLTGRDLISCENNLRLINSNAPLWGTEHVLIIAEKASNINSEELKNLPAKDFMKLQLAILNFFSDTTSQVSLQNNSADAS